MYNLGQEVSFMKTVKVDFIGKRKFKATVRDHEVIIDLPEESGGDDTAPTPSELFIMSLGSCVALFVSRYLETAKLNAEGLSVDLECRFSDDKTRMSDIGISINVPKAVLGARKKAVLAVAEKCAIHNTLHRSPEIKMNVESK
jgi:putative redox protein